MKRILHIIIKTLFFLALSVNAQKNIKKQILVSFESKDIMFNDSNNVIVISILDLEHPEEINKLNKLAEKYINKRVFFVVVTDSYIEKSTSSLKHSLLHYQKLNKENNDLVFNMYQTGMFKVFPIHIVLNPEGKITYKRKGIVKNIEKKLEKRINTILNNFPKFQTNPSSYLYAKNK